MRNFYRLVFAIVCFHSAAAFAAETGFSGSAAIMPSGVIMIDGRHVTLWGIDMLASDQQCWRENRAWDCGDEALTNLRHHLSGHPVHCDVKSDLGGGKVVAQCFRTVPGKDDDIAHYLVVEGWAFDHAVNSGGVYAPDQEKARLNRRGIWTSRFQTAEDWKNGVQNYVQYEQVPPKTPVPPEKPTAIIRMGFLLHPRLEADSIFMRDLGLCQLRLNNVKSVPWLVLVPRCEAVTEIYELSTDDCARLMEEVTQVSKALVALYAPEKINVAALGNVVPQLHVHVMARFKHDAAWPDPVFGRVSMEPYDAAAIAAVKTKLDNAKLWA